ncbi:winged helix-turn-helix transcriptional regulator [Candidatus Bathyarchaeota archaeon]|nr:winged helix-turn-helix transcriptional regulator [Candidatus Bathyarchaeota archaeon]
MKNKNSFKAKVFNALSDPVRLEILEFLHDGEKCVCEIVPHLQIAQPLVSRHLRILKECGLVKHRKDGNRRLYSVTSPVIFKIIDSVTINLMDTLSKHIIEQIA